MARSYIVCGERWPICGARESDLEDDLWNDIITIVGDLSSYKFIPVMIGLIEE